MLGYVNFINASWYNIVYASELTLDSTVCWADYHF